MHLVIRGSRFVGNRADAGGALMAAQWGSDSARVEIHNSLFSGNKVSRDLLQQQLGALHPTSWQVD